jgi:GxxExxY protein
MVLVEEELTSQVIGAAIEVHRHLGPGLLESAYRACLLRELVSQGLSVEQEVAVPIQYKGVQLDCGYRLDLLVADRLVVELKAVERLEPVHTAQVMSYLRLAGYRLGLLLNFHVPVLKDGIRRIILD